MPIPGEMRALLLTNDGYAAEHSGTALEAMEPYLAAGRIAVPQPAPSQVLIRVRLAAINPSDVMFVKGLYGQPRHKGQPAGFEGVGEVVAASGEAAAQALIGQRVAFATGRSNWGSWADYAVAEARGCIPVIPELRDEDAAAMIVNPLTALALFDIVREEEEKSFVLTAGASQLGKLIMGLARDEGFRPIAIVRRDDQIPLLEKAGAAHVLNGNAPDFAARIATVCKAEGPRVLLDAVTGPHASSAFHPMGKRSRWVIYGQMETAETVIQQPGQFIFQDKRVESFWLTEWMRRASSEQRAAAVMQAQRRFADGRWRTDVTAILPLDDAMANAARELARPNGKVFIRP